MATKKKKKAKKPQAQNAQNMSPVQYFLSGRARTLELAECLINSDWKESGMAMIVVARQHKTGNYTFGSFVVDTYCLGVKDTSQAFNRYPEEYQQFKDSIFERGGLTIVNIDYALAHNIIFGALNYAAKLGIAPQKDWKYGQMILEPINAVAKMHLEFGKDGKPFYISGPYDKAQQIIDKLTKAVGEGNFETMMNIGSMGFGNDFDMSDFDDEDDDFDDDDDDENDTQDVDYEEVKS
jgi:hypothetical protein